MMWKLILMMLFSMSLISCSAKFACKDKVNLEGERCESLTSVHEKYIEKEGGKPKGGVSESKGAPPSEEESIVRSLSVETGKPIRLPPRVIRIWIAPWEDTEGDLHQPTFIYSEISPRRGRWLLGEKEIISPAPVLRPLEKVSEKTSEQEPKKEPERPERKSVPGKQSRERSTGLIHEERR